MRALPRLLRSVPSHLLTAAVVCLAAGWVFPQAAPAHTCQSACSQIRRACDGSAKAVWNVARANCDAEAAACIATCQADPLTCPGVACETCIDACGVARDGCRIVAGDARTADRAACEGLRTSCSGVCVDPIDGACVQDCKAQARHQCVRPAKQDELTCKRQCPEGAARQACFRQCRRAHNVVLEACGDSEVRCVGGCIGLTLAP